jgi:hypothetical protein
MPAGSSAAAAVAVDTAWLLALLLSLLALLALLLLLAVASRPLLLLLLAGPAGAASLTTGPLHRTSKAEWQMLGKSCGRERPTRLLPAASQAGCMQVRIFSAIA